MISENDARLSDIVTVGRAEPFVRKLTGPNKISCSSCQGEPLDSKDQEKHR